MPKAMILSVGTGETVAHGISYSIRQQNPDYIVFLITEESKNKILPIILAEECMSDKKYEEFLLKDENDVEEIFLECKKLMDGIMKRCAPKDIVIDFTSGTKAMSAALALTAVEKKIETLVYIYGARRDKNGRVISGTERLMSLKPNRIYAESLFKDAVSLFNSYRFDACLDILNQAKGLTLDPDLTAMIELLEKLSKAYFLWDRFDFEKSFTVLDEISNERLISEWGIKNNVENNKMILYKEKIDFFCMEKAVDLLENARRRGDKEKKFDDASARLYRCIEYIGQFYISKKGLYKKGPGNMCDTENLDIEGLPLHLREEYAKCRSSDDNKARLSLYKNFKLLSDLGDDIGKLFIEQYDKNGLKKLLVLRNNSILAHGFIPIPGHSYKEFFEKVEALVNKIAPEIGIIKKNIRFPQIKI